ncbi:hypothetical protein OJAV_G00210730, partial [Oryzias javanicus]
WTLDSTHFLFSLSLQIRQSEPQKTERQTLSPPQRVHDSAVAPQPQKPVRSRDPVSVGFSGIPEEGVGNPDFPHHVAVEHEQLHGAVKLQPAVIPRLSEEDVDGVLLWRQREPAGGPGGPSFKVKHLNQVSKSRPGGRIRPSSARRRTMSLDQQPGMQRWPSRDWLGNVSMNAGDAALGSESKPLLLRTQQRRLPSQEPSLQKPKNAEIKAVIPLV